MNHSPKHNLKKTYFVSLCFMLAGIINFVFAPCYPIVAPIQGVGLALCSVGIFIMQRYALTDYNFIIEDGEMTIHKISGKRITVVARLALSQCTEFLKIEKKQKPKRKFSGGKYTYTVNLDPSPVFLLVFDDDGKDCGLFLECDETFAAAISALLPNNAQIKL